MSRANLHRVIMGVIVIAVCVILWLLVKMTDNLNDKTRENGEKYSQRK